MHNKTTVQKWMLFGAMSLLAVFGLVFGTPDACAQLTSTNAIELIESNVVTARETLVPIAIGALVLFVGIAAGMKFWKRIFGR